MNAREVIESFLRIKPAKCKEIYSTGEELVYKGKIMAEWEVIDGNISNICYPGSIVVNDIDYNLNLFIQILPGCRINTLLRDIIKNFDFSNKFLNVIDVKVLKTFVGSPWIDK